jgi:tRNA(fMet)-specific endonuclease VapC
VSLYLLDTDTFSLYQRGHARVFQAVVNRPVAALSIITVDELWSGWLTAVRQAKTPDRMALGYARLTETVVELRNWEIVTFAEAAILRHHSLKRQKLNIGGNDLKIAAIALELGATVVTRNVRDFGRVPGLALDDWSK